MFLSQIEYRAVFYLNAASKQQSVEDFVNKYSYVLCYLKDRRWLPGTQSGSPLSHQYQDIGRLLRACATLIENYDATPGEELARVVQAMEAHL